MIIDCFPFFNELDVLEIRLRELDDVVDWFVLTEATRTFSGKDKPLYFADNRRRFKPWSKKIVNFTIKHYTFECGDAWSMDWGQKQWGLQTMLEQCHLDDEDIVLLSDCDEIPRASTVRDFVENPGDGVATPLMPIFYFWLNCLKVGSLGRCCKYITRRRLRETNDDLRTVRGLRNANEIPDGGWHFSYMADVLTKMDSWAHTEFNIPQFRDPGHIRKCREEGLDPFGRQCRYEFLGDLSYLPECVRESPGRFCHLIHP